MCIHILSIVVMVVSGFSQIAVARTIDYQFFEELFGEPVTLSANGMPQRVSDVAINLTVITAEEIQSSGAHSIPEVVQRLAGINVIQWGAESFDVMVRGYNQGYNPRLLVMVNGRQVYLDHYGMTAWAAIPVQMNEIRQIEVVKGPNAALFGFNAVSGAINIVTFNPLYESPSEVSVAVGTAQHTEMNVMGSLRGKEGDWGVRLSASGSASDQYTYEHGWVDLLQPGRNELFLKRDPRRQWVTLDYVAALDEGLHLRIEGSDADSQTNQMYPYGSLVDANYHVRSGKFTLMSERLHGQTEFSLYHNILDYDTVSLYSPRALLKNEVTVFKAENVGKLGVKHAYRVTGEYRFNRMNSSPVNAGKVSTRIVSLSGAWEWKMSSSVSLMNAVRYDNWHSQRAGGFGVLSYPAPSLTNEDFDREINEVSFNSSLIAQLTERDVLRLSAARGALLPSLVELSFLQVSPLPINNTINFLGNPELKPSIVENIEVSWQRQFSRWEAMMQLTGWLQKTENIKSSPSLYDALLTGDMWFNSSGQPIGNLLFQNIGSSSSWGIEWEWEGKLSSHGGYRFSWAWQRIRDELNNQVDRTALGLPPSDLYDYPVVYEGTSPEHVVKASYVWQSGKYDYDVSAVWQQRHKMLRSTAIWGVYDFELQEVRSFVGLSGKVSWNVDENSQLTLSGINLLRSHQQVSAGPWVDRQIFLSYRRKL